MTVSFSNKLKKYGGCDSSSPSHQSEGVCGGQIRMVGLAKIPTEI
jgi:hypothetical protein